MITENHFFEALGEMKGRQWLCCGRTTIAKLPVHFWTQFAATSHAGEEVLGSYFFLWSVSMLLK